MKDPAVLFYFQDFLVGTEFMTDDEVGKYIRILCHQADKGALSKLHLERICRGAIPDAVLEKFTINDEGNYYQRRMQIEKDKRVKHIEHQKNNALKRWDKEKCRGNAVAMPLLNENENEDINININEDSNKEVERKNQFEQFRKSYPGTKRGFNIEYENFKKKHKDWREIIPLLNIRLDYQRTVRAKKAALKAFVPEWKNLQTWINQRCWEEEIPIETVSQAPITYEEIVSRSEKDPSVWNRYKAVKREGERKALFYPIDTEL